MSVALTIAGSDCSGGGGIQADIKTFSALGVYGASVIVALTAQNTKGVQGVFFPPIEFARKQIQSVYDDLKVDAVKIGMLATKDHVLAVADVLRTVKARNIVLDPVMVSKSGDRLLEDGAIEALKTHLMPLVDIMTPNIPEALAILGRQDPIVPEHMSNVVEKLWASSRVKSVLLKGGHVLGEKATDVFFDGTECTFFTGERVHTKNTHGTGCTLSSAIAAGLAKDYPLPKAIEDAKQYVTKAIQFADTLGVGQGCGPIDHFYKVWGR